MKSFHHHCWGLLLVPLLLAAPACQRPEEAPKPANLVSKEKMITLLADLHVLEARVESSRLSPDSARALYLAQQKDVLWKNEVSDSAFHSSYHYYGIHGKDLNEIYTAVVDTLGHREGRLDPKAATAQAASEKWNGPAPK